jgi:hypothetical protein
MTSKDLQGLKKQYASGKPYSTNPAIEISAARRDVQKLIAYIEKLEKLRASDKEAIRTLEASDRELIRLKKQVVNQINNYN